MDGSEKVAKLDSKNHTRARGERAKQASIAVMPFLDELRGKYIERLSRKMKDGGESDTYAAVAIIVLKDISDFLDEERARGESAERKIRQLMNQ